LITWIHNIKWPAKPRSIQIYSMALFLNWFLTNGLWDGLLYPFTLTTLYNVGIRCENKM
jgi:hypothetical protein